MVKSGNLVNVHTGEILEDVDVAVRAKRIALVGEADRCLGDGTMIIDAEGRYLVPGFLDAHVHIESSMITVTQFARAVLPHGTTSVFIDPHEIANVLGLGGVKLMYKEARDLPLKVFLEIPSCVPSAPGLETTGAEIDWRDVEEGLGFERAVGLAEVMNFLGVLSKDEKLFREVEVTIASRGVVEGHAPLLLGGALNAYVAAGISSDHESSTPEEILQKLRLGMKMEIREGSTAKDLAALVKPILKEELDMRHCLLATDDRHPVDLIREGHMDHVLRRAVEEGVDPVRAIQMATINTAEHFRVDGDVGSIAPGRLADIVIVDRLEDFRAQMVIADGAPVASRGKLLIALREPRYPRFAKETMNLGEVKPENFEIRGPRSSRCVEVRVIGVREDRVLTEHRILTLEVENGFLRVDPGRDVAKIAVVERHRGTGYIGLGFVQGFGVKAGAMASSVGHDAHNITALGICDRDMALAVNVLREVGGGQVVVKDGRVLALLKLEVAGLMSERGVEEVAEDLVRLDEAARSLQVGLRSPFMHLSFLPLAVIPRLRITDKGLVDVEKLRLVELIVE